MENPIKMDDLGVPESEYLRSYFMVILFLVSYYHY